MSNSLSEVNNYAELTSLNDLNTAQLREFLKGAREELKKLDSLIDAVEEAEWGPRTLYANLLEKGLSFDEIERKYRSSRRAYFIWYFIKIAIVAAIVVATIIISSIYEHPQAQALSVLIPLGVSIIAGKIVFVRESRIPGRYIWLRRRARSRNGILKDQRDFEEYERAVAEADAYI